MSPLPFYSNIEEQNHRKSYAYGAVYPLYAPSAFLLPFQIMKVHDGRSITSASLYTKKGDYVVDMLQQLNIGGMRLLEYEDYGIDIVMYPETISNNLQIMDGQYYITLSDGNATWYSEIITVVQDITPYLKVEWYDVDDLYADCGIISYQNGYKNVLYFATELGKPEYTFDEEGETRDGYFFAEKQLSKKTYKFFFPSSEYLLDAMRLVRLSDYVKITDKYGRVYNCDTFLITPEWEEQGNIARVVAEFQTATVVKKIGKGFILKDGRSFNNDYNEDYN
jgi:hypothetical protein